MREVDFTAVLPGGQYVDSRTSLLFMISFAYNVRHPGKQLIGLPKWAQEQQFAVSAKPEPGFPVLSTAANLDEVRRMLRVMLADRFHLRLHTETRRERIFNLDVAKGGLKTKEVDPPIPPAKEGHVGAALGNRGGRMIGRKSTMSGLAAALTIFVDRLVVDNTGLKGYYDFDVKWTASTGPDGQLPEPGFGPDAQGLLLSALQDHFGLKLTNSVGPVEYWIVDQVELPTEN